MLIVFDLDFTLWNCGETWCDHTSPPYRRHKGAVRDAMNRKIILYPDVLEILKKLKSDRISMAIASRTYAPDWASELMDLLDIQKYFDHFEIYPGSKLGHFRSLHQKTKIAFEKMVFFDDEERNVQEVAQLGVQTVLVRSGMNNDLLNAFLPHLFY